MSSALNQQEYRVAVAIDFSDMLAGDPDRQGESERRALIQLQKAIQNARFVEGDDGTELRNTLILVARELGRVPSWFYKNNPSLALVNVGKPDMDERKQQVGRWMDGEHPFYGAEQATEQGTTEELAELTEGFSYLDLEALRRTSHIETIPVAEPRTLVNHFIHGRREDPWRSVDPAKLRDARDQLQARVFGQAAAVEKMAQMLKLAATGVRMSPPRSEAGKPKGIFFFAGPTGVGKTELAKAATELVFNDENAYKRFDMSEFRSEHARERLIGSPPGYVGHDQGGELTNWMREHPRTILLFDEIEKAHQTILELFLQIFDDGRLTDSKGQTVYFHHAILIFTSNIGNNELDRHTTNQSAQELPYEDIRQIFEDAVEDHFTHTLKRPELLGRIGKQNIIAFDILRPPQVHALCSKFLRWIAASVWEEQGVEVQFDDEGIAELVHELVDKEQGWKYGGRAIQQQLQQIVLPTISDWILDQQPQPGQRIRISVDQEGHGVSIDRIR
jgi:ATP-dependent Clp protease ATP-binding subunit ClpA